MNLTKITKILIFVISMTLFFECSSFGQEKESKKITVIGQSEIVDKNTFTARDNAIEEAMRKAVEQSVEKFVSSETILENFQLISDKIYSKSKSYIESFKVLSEKIQEEVYFVTIEAYVTFDNIKADLTAMKILSQKKNLPRFTNFISEKNIGSKNYKYWWTNNKKYYIENSVSGNEMAKRLMEKGFYSVDKSIITKKIKQKRKNNKADLQDSEAIDLIQQTGAEIVIIGKALTKVMGSIKGTQMKSILANISARVIDVDGELIASDSASAKVLHVDESLGGNEALKKAAVMLADRLIEQILVVWGEEEKDIAVISINVKGLTYKRLMSFMKILNDDIRGVTNVAQKSFTSGGKANLDVEIKGNVSFLANELSKRDFPELGVEVTSYTPGHLEVNLKDKD